MKTTEQDVPNTEEVQPVPETEAQPVTEVEDTTKDESISHTQMLRELDLDTEELQQTRSGNKQTITVGRLLLTAAGVLTFAVSTGVVIYQQLQVLKVKEVYNEEVQQLDKLTAANNDKIDTLNQLKSAGTGFTPTQQQEITSYVDAALTMQQNELPNIQATTQTINNILNFKEEHLTYTLDDDIGLALNNVKEQRKLLAEPQTLEDYKVYYNLTKTPKLDK